MANVAFQLQPNFNFNLLFRSPPLRSLPIKLSFAFKLDYSSCKMIRYSPKLRVECFFMSPKPKGENVIGGIGSLEDNDHTHGCTALAASSGVGSAVGDNLGFGAFMMTLGSILTVVAFCLVVFNTERKSILKLQVGLSGTSRSLQKDLNRIAKTANRYSPEGLSSVGLSYLLQETTLALLRHPDFCISGYSSVYTKRSIDEVENQFNQLCIEERGKFAVETLVKINNIGKQHATTQIYKDFRNEYIVITIIVAAEGGYNLPTINSSAKLKEALIKLATIPSSRVKALVVLLTPPNENDAVTEQKFLEDYSLLHPL
ncbi:unnamed protein product [Lactuca saligna]|uniref:Uncharacterized protein n=1 Tax=Lactuca saligna TaxID=75948 RepID=A0AA35YEJ6_LACSI|nr:unnamed protein product [Lactuca saligna]